MELYYIKDRETGLYSSGGYGPRWSAKKPKLWTLGALKGHLGHFSTGYPRQMAIPVSWDVYCVDLAISDQQPLMPARAAYTYKRPKPPKR